jgi:lysophospholipase L1-like esterase
MLRRLPLPVALLLLAAVLPGSPAEADAGPAPSSMAALGDSITRGFNACGWFAECTSRSWSTGDNATVSSHYLRIRAKNSAMTGHAYNESKTGASSAGIAAQAQAAANRRVGYVTMLIGANDACTSSEAAMTPVSTFRSRIDSALAALKAGTPNAKLYVLSIPDLKRLWFIGKDNSSARSAWSMFNICQSILARPTSVAAADVARRDRVRQRVMEFNGQLAAACAAYGTNCRYDNSELFAYPFLLSQVSTWDYFHPNAAGQKVLAELSYARGYNW